MSFKQLNAIDCTKHVEKKGKFTYLSWAWAWQTLKDHCPDATFRKHTFSARDNDGVQVPFMVDEAGYAYVMVTVTVDGLEATEIMPVLNHSNKPLQNPNSFDVNTALQRTLVKAIAFHGLGLYIYAGEDVNPVQDTTEPRKAKSETKYIGLADIVIIRGRMTATNTDERAFCKFLSVGKLAELPLDQYSKAMVALQAKADKNAS
jgi:hypothetical protein